MTAHPAMQALARIRKSLSPDQIAYRREDLALVARAVQIGIAARGNQIGHLPAAPAKIVPLSEWARIRNMNPRTARDMAARQQCLPGAQKIGDVWFVPENSKPKAKQ